MGVKRRPGFAPIVVAALAVGTLAGCRSDPGVLLDAACDQLAIVEANRSHDVTDPDAVRKLVEVLPDELLAEAALYYYPDGGSVDGLDTSGTNAEKAGRTLHASLQKCDR